MNIEQINQEWSADCSFDLEDLAAESARIGKLHQKYYKLYIDDKIRLTQMEDDLNEKKQIKRRYYKGLMDREELEQRNLPQFDVKLMRDEVNEYLDSDPEIVAIRLRVATVRERTEYLKSIIDQIKQRSFNIRNAVEWKKFEAGF